MKLQNIRGRIGRINIPVSKLPSEMYFERLKTIIWYQSPHRDRHFEWSPFGRYINQVLRRNEKSPDVDAN
jgi:hypothetical protein